MAQTRFPECMLARQGVVTLIDIGGRDCVEIVKKLIVPIKARPAKYPRLGPRGAHSSLTR